MLNQKIGKLIDSGRLKNSYRLINQMEGSAGSKMDNIAEGYERSDNLEFLQFLYIAKGSCGELRSQLYRAFDRQYINEEELRELSDESMRVSNLIQKLINYLVTSNMSGSKYKEPPENNA